MLFIPIYLHIIPYLHYIILVALAILAYVTKWDLQGPIPISEYSAYSTDSVAGSGFASQPESDPQPVEDTPNYSTSV